MIFQSEELISENLKGSLYAAELMRESEDLSSKSGCCIIKDMASVSNGQPVIEFSMGGVSLICSGMKMKGDLSSMIPRLNEHNLNRELLVRAAGKVHGTEKYAVDATAGMGEDSLMLAAAGFNVILFENDPVIAALLRDSLRRANMDPRLKSITERMTLVEGNSIDALKTAGRAGSIIPEKLDVIYLDPMFPERTKSASVKKKFQLLHFLEKPCENEEELLSAAIGAGPGRIVIKRPLKSGALANCRPSFSLKGSTVRYDCIIKVE